MSRSANVGAYCLCEVAVVYKSMSSMDWCAALLSLAVIAFHPVCPRTKATCNRRRGRYETCNRCPGN